jgi:hypothetical protein
VSKLTRGISCGSSGNSLEINAVGEQNRLQFRNLAAFLSSYILNKLDMHHPISIKSVHPL